jgi:hypothetical protein
MLHCRYINVKVWQSINYLAHMIVSKKDHSYSQISLKIHKRENFLGSDFEYNTFS